MLRALAAIIAVLCTSSPAVAEESAKSPNLVLILADDLGYGELGCYGQRKIRTPRLDALAAQGTRFTRFYASAPVCAPTRCSLLTGLHTGHSFVRDNRELPTEGQLPLPAGSRTLARLLKDAGYTTGMVGKWGLGGPGSTGVPDLQGFDHYFGFLCQREAHNYYPSYLWRDGQKVPLEGNVAGNAVGARHVQGLFVEEAETFLRSNRARPFFLYLPVTIPHMSIQPPEEDLAEYRGRWDDPPYDGKQGYFPHPSPRAGYAAMVTRLDRDVGRILDLLKELGLEDSTLVVFTSDNGPTYGHVGGADSDFFESSGGLRGRKGSVYEGGLRVPLIARWPGHVPAGRVSDHVGALYDLMPTFLELAGAPAAAGLDGLSLVPALVGRPGQQTHEFLYWEFPSYGGQQAVLAGRYKGVRQKLLNGPATFEIYDLQTDERESTNIAGKNPELVARLTDLMGRARTPSPQFPFPALDRSGN